MEDEDPFDTISLANSAPPEPTRGQAAATRHNSTVPHKWQRQWKKAHGTAERGSPSRAAAANDDEENDLDADEEEGTARALPVKERRRRPRRKRRGFEVVPSREDGELDARRCGVETPSTCVCGASLVVVMLCAAAAARVLRRAPLHGTGIGAAAEDMLTSDAEKQGDRKLSSSN